MRGAEDVIHRLRYGHWPIWVEVAFDTFGPDFKCARCGRWCVFP